VPGPGSYRVPSEFGHYEAKTKYGDEHAPAATLNASIEAKKTSSPKAKDSPSKAAEAKKAWWTKKNSCCIEERFY